MEYWKYRKKYLQNKDKVFHSNTLEGNYFYMAHFQNNQLRHEENKFSAVLLLLL